MSRKQSRPTRHEYNYDQTPPAFAAEVEVPANVKNRTIISAVSVTGGVGVASSVNIEVETGVGTGVFEIATRWRGAVGTSAITTEGTAMCPAGRKYRFVEDETGGSRSIVRYGYVDELI